MTFFMQRDIFFPLEKRARMNRIVHNKIGNSETNFHFMLTLMPEGSVPHTSVMMALCCRTRSYSSLMLMLCNSDSGSALPSRHSTAWHLPTLAEVRVKQPAGSVGSWRMWQSAAEPPSFCPAVPNLLLNGEGKGQTCLVLIKISPYRLSPQHRLLRVHLPLHDQEGVGHVVFLALGPVQFFCQYVVHGALE